MPKPVEDPRIATIAAMVQVVAPDARLDENLNAPPYERFSIYAGERMIGAPLMSPFHAWKNALRRILAELGL